MYDFRSAPLLAAFGMHAQDKSVPHKSLSRGAQPPSGEVAAEEGCLLGASEYVGIRLAQRIKETALNAYVTETAEDVLRGLHAVPPNCLGRDDMLGPYFGRSVEQRVGDGKTQFLRLPTRRDFAYETIPLGFRSVEFYPHDLGLRCPPHQTTGPRGADHDPKSLRERLENRRVDRSRAWERL